MKGQQGSAAITVVVLMPLLVGVLAGVIELGALRVLAGRVSAAADLAALAAADDQDADALVASGKLRLAPDAVLVARQFFALNLEPIAPHLATAPEVAAQDADIVAFPDAPVTDPLTGWRFDRPTVRIAASVPVRTPVFGALLLPSIVAVNVRAASAAR
jgi:Flp pilus assembly protein TadG